MSHPLAALLPILQNPDHPHFAEAVAKLNALNLNTLPADELTALLAQLDTTIATLTSHRDDTARQLKNLRTGALALQSYKVAG